MFRLLLPSQNGIPKWSVFFHLLILSVPVNCYTAVGRYGHSAVLMDNSIYFYGGDSSITASTRTPLWLSDLAVLNLSGSFPLQQPNWSPISGTQSILGGPSVYYHVGFADDHGSKQMLIVGGITPSAQSQNNNSAYMYDAARRQWTQLSLPDQDVVHRQGAAVSTTSNGQAYLWGGKTITGELFMNSLALRQEKPPEDTPAPPNASQLVYRLNCTNPNDSSLVIPNGNEIPNMRYSHSQTIINDTIIVVLGGFDGISGTPTSLGDVWLFDISTSTWTNIQAGLSPDGRPAARSSHSAVLMADGKSIVIYGGYDGYNVFNDVAILHTDTWTWEVKSTTANVQGRADHSGEHGSTTCRADIIL
ncbi:hypothetical protein BC943DRAFT_114414 [Umbelopsis sp. AD052]|nr:hypothetical protein BC943DRAFT_114414 [Umbelopsis sp. AD052]